METEKHSPKWLLNEIRNTESDEHALFKIIEFQNALTEQCNIANVGDSREVCGTCGSADFAHHGFCPKCDTDAYSY